VPGEPAIPTPNYYKTASINQGGVVGFLNKLGNASMGGARMAEDRRS